MKRYIVNFDMNWSEDVKVSAKSKSSAKKEAWNKLKKKLSRRYFVISCEPDPSSS